MHSNDVMSHLLIHPKGELERKREMKRMPVLVPSWAVSELSNNEHLLLHKKIVEDLLPLWGMGVEVLSVRNSADKYLHRDAKALQQLHITLEHGTLPDYYSIPYQNGRSEAFEGNCLGNGSVVCQRTQSHDAPQRV